MKLDKVKPGGRYEKVQFYEMLFSDNPKLYFDIVQNPQSYPWIHFLEAPQTRAGLWKVVDDARLESRVRILAYNTIREHEKVKRKELLGVIIEIGLADSVDVLACYRDNRVRMIHHSGRVLIWDQMGPKTLTLISQLFTHCEYMITQLGPWDGGRLNPPKPGKARISFLVSDGLYFGEAESDTLFNDPFSAPALGFALNILEHITSEPCEV